MYSIYIWKFVFDSKTETKNNIGTSKQTKSKSNAKILISLTQTNIASAIFACIYEQMFQANEQSQNSKVHITLIEQFDFTLSPLPMLFFFHSSSPSVVESRFNTQSRALFVYLLFINDSDRFLNEPLL